MLSETPPCRSVCVYAHILQNRDLSLHQSTFCFIKVTELPPKIKMSGMILWGNNIFMDNCCYFLSWQIRPRGLVMPSLPSATWLLPVKTSKSGSSLPRPFQFPPTAAAMETQSVLAVCGFPWPKRWRTAKTLTTS